MKAHFLVFFIHYPLICYTILRIPLDSPSTYPNRFSSQKILNRQKREESANATPVIIYDPASYGMIGVGSPIQYIPLLFDTYGNRSWLLASNCTISICYVTDVFKLEKSQTFNFLNKIEKSYYKEFLLEGGLSTDTFEVGNIKVDDVTFISVNSINGTGSVLREHTESVAGIIQLGISQKFGGTTFLEKLYSDKIIEEKVFGIKVRRYKDENVDGEIYLGTWNREYVSENKTINWIPLSSKSYWEFNVAKLSYGTLSLLEDGRAVVDTGVSILLGPEDVIQKLFMALGNTFAINPITITSFLSDYESYTVNCSESLPDFDFLIHKRHYTLSSKEYLLPMPDNKDLCVFGIGSSKRKTTNVWRLGDVFLSKFYTIGDGENFRLSFNNYINQ